MTGRLWACGLILVLTSRVPADPATLAPGPLVVRPQTPPVPSLRYRLLPTLSDQKPGDAAPLYKEAAAALEKKDRDGNYQAVTSALLARWQDQKLEDLPRAAVHDFLKPYQDVLRTVDRAARCEHCDWGVSERLREQGIGAPLPEIQPVRQFADLLALRARLALAEGRLEDALRDVQTGLTLARQIGRAPTIIEVLVGIAITEQMTRVLAEAIQRDEAPNLYWALTALPRPFLDLRPGLEGERLTVHHIFPDLGDAADDLNAPPLSAAKARGLRQFLLLIDQQEVSPLVRRVVPRQARQLAGLLHGGDAILARHDAATRALIEAGRPRALVEAMPYLEVAVLHALLDYDRTLDDVLRWQSLPFWEANPRIQELAERRKKRGDEAPDAPALPLARYLLPAVEKLSAAPPRVDRRLAALRTVEALRLYAAAHDGKLPTTLGELNDVPVPVDPITGRPFDYQVAGGRVTLYGPPWEHKDTPSPLNALRVEVRVKR